MEDNKNPAPISKDETLDEASSVVEPGSSQPVAGGVPDGGTKKPERSPLLLKLRRWISSSNLYLIIFILLIILVALGIFTFTRLNQQEPNKLEPEALTEQQLAELKGSTTVIGDSQQILDIQSSSVFENQVLMRGNLDVAGTVKVGGPLNLAAVSVGGTSTFGQVQINDTLTVVGNAVLQRNLTVNGTSSFKGALSAAQINVTNLQLTGDFTVSRHIAGGGGTPGRTNGSALGGGGTASISGTDTAGTVTINTGSSPPVGCFATINFTNAFSSTPHVVISPSNSSSAGLNYYTNRTASNFSICTTNSPSASTTYLFDYHVFD